jgi:CMP-N,N'-diacetyllegionaminic acid synthase
MIDDKRVLAVIPARGGSKGVPRKNIAPLAGRPLIEYTIDQAIAASTLDLTVVSTDDGEIKAVAQARGIRVIDRPEALASDTASTEVALLHALDVLEAARVPPFDYIVVLEPTSPFRSAATIDGAVRALAASGEVSLVAVRETRENIGTIQDGIFKPIVPGAPRRRQDRAPFYIESSTIYVCETGYLRAAGTLVADRWAAYVAPEDETDDINTREDFQRVEFLMRQRMGDA